MAYWTLEDIEKLIPVQKLVMAVSRAALINGSVEASGMTEQKPQFSSTDKVFSRDLMADF